LSAVATVTGNRIGTSSSGAALLANTGPGIRVTSGLQTIGGPTAAERNVIAGNTTRGIEFAAASGGTVAGNYIGVAANGTTPIGNTSHGIYGITVGNLTIGGATAAHGNLIANNGGDGIRIESALSVQIQNNVFGSNTGSAINNVTPPVAVPEPVLSSVIYTLAGQIAPAATGTLTVTGSITGASPATAFTVDVMSAATCDGNGRLEGATILGSIATTTDGSGNATFSGTVPGIPNADTQVGATIRGGPGTSGFSLCVAAQGVAPPTTTTTIATGAGSLARSGTPAVRTSLGGFGLIAAGAALVAFSGANAARRNKRRSTGGRKYL
jgi:hypothetical protein